MTCNYTFTFLTYLFCLMKCSRLQFWKVESIEQVGNPTIQRFEQNTSTKVAVYMMDKEFEKSGKLFFFLHVDIKIRTATAYCRRRPIKYVFSFSVILFRLLFSKYIFFITCKLQALKLLFAVKQQISVSDQSHIICIISYQIHAQN